ncbi:MAG: hypothetical protein ACRDOD_14795 [Streptosporangiaceae bacterium]
MSVPQPPHPVGALTTSELSRYRSELEHALQAQHGAGPSRGVLQARLAEVLTEQDDRRCGGGPVQERAR